MKSVNPCRRIYRFLVARNPVIVQLEATFDNLSPFPLWDPSIDGIRSTEVVRQSVRPSHATCAAQVSGTWERLHFVRCDIRLAGERTYVQIVLLLEGFECCWALSACPDSLRHPSYPGGSSSDTIVSGQFIALLKKWSFLHWGSDIIPISKGN